MITSTEKKVYGLKIINDEFGEYHKDDVFLGNKMSTYCVIDIKHDVGKSFIQSALMLSPKEACLKHVTHLLMHKRFGSTDQDRAVMLNDYVKALYNYPEFVLFQVCRYYWENDRRPFVPYISEIKEACEILQKTLQNHIDRIMNPKDSIPEKKEKIEISYKDKSVLHWTKEDYRDWVMDAESMLKMAENNPNIFNVLSWQEEVTRRQAEADKHG